LRGLGGARLRGGLAVSKSPALLLELTKLLALLACSCIKVLCYLALFQLRALIVKREIRCLLEESGVPAETAKEIADDYIRSARELISTSVDLVNAARKLAIRKLRC